VQYIVFDGPGYLQTSREALAKYMGVADKDDLVFVTNPSFAVNMVAKNFPLQPGDQILTTDIEYGACDRTWEYYCAQKGAEYIKQKITLPITSKEKFIEEFFAGITPKTKAVFISHITSATALKLPVEEICAIAKQKGLITFVDGAHGPAQTSVDLANLAADFYTGACHKWMMAPKGCSFLYAHKSVQPICDPLVVSWGYKALKPSHSKFLDYHQMIGTRDFSAFLTIPDCISFMETYNWKEVSKKCHELVLSNAQRFFDLLGATPISPLTSEWIGQMISIPIKTSEPELLQRTLFTEYQIEVPIMRQGSDVYLRYSINGFNSQSDMNRLYQVVAELQQQGRL
jgi:isopenicillin-N epimerase